VPQNDSLWAKVGLVSNFVLAAQAGASSKRVPAWHLRGWLLPSLLALRLCPTSRDAQVPAWPFVGLSFALGVLALGPYFALWTPAGDVVAPPRAADLKGWRNLSLRITESRVTAALLLLATVVTLGQARARRSCPGGCRGREVLCRTAATRPSALCDPFFCAPAPLLRAWPCQVDRRQPVPRPRHGPTPVQGAAASA